MLRYIDAAKELALTGKGMSQQEIAAAAAVSPFQVSRWHQQPEFRDAIAEAFRQMQPVALERAINALIRHAERGNLAIFNAVCDRFERWGRISVVSTGDPQMSAPTGAFAVAGTHVHIHGIPEPASRTTLPPPVELPASATAVLSQPK